MLDMIQIIGTFFILGGIITFGEKADIAIRKYLNDRRSK